MAENAHSKINVVSSKENSEYPVVVCATDENFIMPTAVMLKSLIVNIKKYNKIKIFILCSGLTESHKNKILDSIRSEKADIEFLLVDDKLIKDFKVLKGFTLATYYRLLIPSILSDKIKKVIYLDVDMLINEDIGKLWDVDLNNNYALAVQDQSPFWQYICQFLDSVIMNDYKQSGLNLKSKYFNAGVLVIDLEKWRNNKISEKILEYVDKNGKKVKQQDQEGINMVLLNKIGELDLRWNLLDQLFWNNSWRDCPVKSKEEYDLLVKNPYIIHFNSPRKPWKFRCNSPFRNLFFHYLDMTEWKGWKPKLTLDEAIQCVTNNIKRRFKGHINKKQSNVT